MRELYKRYESGASLRNLQDWLEENQIKSVLGESKWTTTSIKSILTNEKYCGDVLLQKTFRTDVISKKVIKNVGQMAQYYMPCLLYTSWEGAERSAVSAGYERNLRRKSDT